MKPSVISDLECPYCGEIHYYVSFKMRPDPLDGEEKPCAILHCWGCDCKATMFSTSKMLDMRKRKAWRKAR